MMENQEELFDLSAQSQLKGKTCRMCIHRQPWEAGSKVIQYCGLRKSNRTQNGLLKIRAKDAACASFKGEEKEQGSTESR
ncbi:MAG: hypothetical protein ACI8Q1_000268 [Parvicella sp.]|jgi:hypothetical protein